MNRQKMLLVVVGGLGALMLVKTLVGVYRSALSDRDHDITQLKIKLAQAESGKIEASVNTHEWEKFGAQTLSMDSDEAIRRLRDELFDLIKKSNLTKEKVDTAVVQGWGKNGVHVLSCGVSAEGDISTIDQFLYALYRRPYQVRVRTLTITELTGKNIPIGHLKMSAKLETLILPPNARMPVIRPVDLKHDKDIDRTKYAKLDDYKVILDRKIWEPYVPPMPGKATVVLPARDATDVDPARLTLKWAAGSNTQKHQVFLGEGSPSQSIGTVTQTELQHTGLKPGVLYAWRVDEIGEAGTTPGDVWRFTTKGALPPPAAVAQAPTVVAPPPPPPPPPADANMILDRTLSSPVHQEAILVDPGAAAIRTASPGNAAAPTGPDKRVEVGESFYGGTLVFVHSLGAISEKDGQLRFHPKGAALKDAQPFTEQDQPEIWHEVQKLEAQATGISDRPG